MGRRSPSHGGLPCDLAPAQGGARPGWHPVGETAGGVYLWESKAKAQAWYTDEWKKNMTAAWGQAPMLEYLDCPIVVDSARVHSRIA